MNISQNPYQISKASDPVLGQGSLADKFKTIKDDEDKSKAPKILPSPLNSLIDIVGNIYVSMSQARNIVDQAANNATVNSSQHEKIKNKVDNINKEILDLTYLLSNISL